jgi:hypothetical protein
MKKAVYSVTFPEITGLSSEDVVTTGKLKIHKSGTYLVRRSCGVFGEHSSSTNINWYIRNILYRNSVAFSNRLDFFSIGSFKQTSITSGHGLFYDQNIVYLNEGDELLCTIKIKALGMTASTGEVQKAKIVAEEL